MYSVFYPSEGVKTPSEFERNDNPTSREEHIKRNLVDLAKRLEEANTFLTASRSYLAGSAKNLEIAKRQMCVSEVDILTATDCVEQTERKLQTMHSELHSLYQNIFSKNSCYSSQDNESERNSDKIHATGAIPMYALNVLNRYAHDMSLDIERCLAKCYEYRRSTYVVLNPTHIRLRSQNGEGRPHSVCDFRPCKTRGMDEYSTVNAGNANYKNSGSVNQRHGGGGLQCQNPPDHKLWFPVDYTMNTPNCRNAPSETAIEICPRDRVVFLYRSKPPYSPNNLSRADSIIPTSPPANSGTNAASQSDWSFDDCKNRVTNFSTKPKLFEDYSHLQTCSNSGSTTETKSKQNDSNFRSFTRFSEIPASKINDLNGRCGTQLSGQQSKEKRIERSSNHSSFYGTKEKGVIEEVDAVYMPEAATHSSNSFISKKQTRPKEIYEQSSQNAEENFVRIVKRNRPKKCKKAGGCSSSLTKYIQTCEAGRGKDSSLNPEGQSNQSADEISFPVDSGTTSLKVSKRTDNRNIGNLVHTFESDTMLKDEMTNNSALSAPSCTSYLPDETSSFTPDVEPSEGIENAIFLPIIKRKTKSKSRSRSFLWRPYQRMKHLNCSELPKSPGNSPDNVSSDKFSSDASSDYTETLNNDVDNKDFKRLLFDTVSRNTASLDSNMELGSPDNRPLAQKKFSSLLEKSRYIALQPCIGKQKSNPTTITYTVLPARVIEKIKDPQASNSVSNEAISYMQSEDENSFIVHQGISVTKKTSNKSCEPNDSCSEPSESHFQYRKPFYDYKDAIVLESEFPESSSALNSSEIMDAGSEFLETSSFRHEINFDPKHEDYSSSNNESVSSKETRSKGYHNDLSTFCMGAPSNDVSSKNSRLLSTEKISTTELAGTSSTSLDSQSKTSRLLRKNSSSSPLKNSGSSPKSNFEDLQKSCVDFSTLDISKSQS